MDADPLEQNGETHISPKVLSWLKHGVGYFTPFDREIELFENIEKSNIKAVTVILNIASVVDISYLNNFSKIKSILLTYLPGMEGGTAIADVLCGDVNPCGKLTDTIALSYNDYPSAPYYNKLETISEYKEDIFVGYRYFETFARDRVLYPFGFGLSYTEFELSNYGISFIENKVIAKVTVKNIGNIAGKEVIQMYSSSPKGELKKPLIELRAYAKTNLLKPNEQEVITLSFDIKDMASFDDSGITGNKLAWVLEKGKYTLFIGNSVRNIREVGNYKVTGTTVIEQMAVSLQSDCIEKSEIDYDFDYKDAGINKEISLYDVADGKNTINEFVRQLTAEELIHLAQGQFPDFAKGTAGIGNLEKYGIPNPQTADGPAGLRKSVPTTGFPCPSLVASSWDRELQVKIGEAMGFEGISTGVDVLLAPGFNIHRNPLCGRNFEYYSEDPYLSGETAVALVNGIQSKGLCATIKHFFANNCEKNRLNNNSIISERAIREIYLKPFEIAVKKSNPAFVMSAYNFVNGVKCSTNKTLLTDILRNEWHYDGAVMTDWRNWTHLWEEIKAGNNIRMPFGYPEEEALALEKYNSGELTRAELENNAIDILKAIMKTYRFKNKNFGIYHKVIPENETKICVTETLGVSTTRVAVGKKDDDNSPYFYMLAKDQRQYPTSVFYGIDVEKSGEYKLSADIMTDCPESRLWVSIDGELITKISCEIATDKEKWYTVSGEIPLSRGKHKIQIMIVNFLDEKFEYLDGWYNPTEDLALSSLKFAKI